MGCISLYGVNDIRLEALELLTITEEKLLIRVVSDSVCASTYKAVKQGAAHKRVPPDIAENPVIVGHELSGEILQVGKSLQAQWQVGQKVVLQPALKLENGYNPGYSYPYIGGNTQYAVVPKLVLERGCLLSYEGEGFFAGPPVHDLQGSLNLYRIHYDGIHVVGTAASIPQDMEDVLRLMEERKMEPRAMVSHILGLDAPAALLKGSR